MVSTTVCSSVWHSVKVQTCNPIVEQTQSLISVQLLHLSQCEMHIYPSRLPEGKSPGYSSIFSKRNIHLTCVPEILIISMYPKIHIYSPKDMYKNDCSVVISNSKKLETTQCQFFIELINFGMFMQWDIMQQ